MRQLTGLDAQFLAIESDTHVGHVGGLAVFDPSTAPGGELRLDDIRGLLAERLHLLPPMRWKLEGVPLGLDHPYWVDDDDFDLDYHVRELALPAPGDDAQLAEQVSRLSARRLDRDYPLWELYVIQGLADGKVAILTKMHHAMIDGMSGAEIMGVLFDLAPEGREIPPAPEDLERPSMPSGAEMLGRGLAGIPKTAWRAIESVPTVVPNLDVFPSILGVPGAESISRNASRVRNFVAGGRDGEIIERPRMRAPQVPFSTRISAHRRFAFGSLPLEDVKKVKNHFGVTVNDVVVALCASATRDWLVTNDALPDGPLLAQIPVSVRSEEQMGTYGNRISIMIVPVATDEPDPVTRLQRTHDSLVAAKERHKALPAATLQNVANFIPPAIHARATRAALQLGASQSGRPLYNMVISNVPGPPIPLYMGGAQLVANYPVSVITDGAGLNITVLSYRESMDFGIIVDREQIPDPDSLMGSFSEALGELLELIDAE